MRDTSRAILRSEVEQLFADYAWAVDTGDFGLLREVFTHKATYVIATSVGQAFDPIVGPDALEAFLVERAEMRSDERKHAITNVRVTSAGDEATALLSVSSVSDRGIHVRNTGVYRVTLEAGESSLRFASMHLEVDVPA